MRIMIALLVTLGLSGATIAGLVWKKSASSSAESTDLSDCSVHAREDSANITNRTGGSGRKVRGDDAGVAAGEMNDDTVLKLLEFTNEHVSRWEWQYEYDRRLAVDSLKSSQDDILKLVEGKAPLNLKAAAVAGRDKANGIHTRMQSVFTARREFNKALAELPEVYIKAADYYRSKNTDEARRMAELLERRAVAVRNKTRSPVLPDESVMATLPTLASFFSDFGNTFGREPKVVTELSDSGPNGEEAYLRRKLQELGAVIRSLLGSLTGGLTAPSPPVGVTAQQQEILPLWDVSWFASRTVEGGVLLEELRLSREGTFERRYYLPEKLSRGNPRVIIEQGRFTIADNTLSFWDGDKLTERGRVEFESPREFVLFIDLPRAILAASASGPIRYSSLARGH